MARKKTAEQQLKELDNDIGKLKKRIAELEGKQSDQSTPAGELGQVLSELTDSRRTLAALQSRRAMLNTQRMEELAAESIVELRRVEKYSIPYLEDYLSQAVQE